MTYFTTEMVFIHPPRHVVGHYAGPRRIRFGCRTQPQAQAHEDARAASADAAAAATGDTATAAAPDIGLAA